MAELTTKKVDEIQGEILHVYDGIEEADNELPLWWLWTFYGAIAFAVVYWFYYHEYEVGPLPAEAYAIEMQSRAGDGADVPEDVLVALAGDPTTVSAGQGLFGEHCAQCHEAEGQGNIGPNLTDGYWIHGGGPTDIHHTIYEGVLQSGMPAWGATLGSESVQQLTAFVLSIRGTNREGKEPQGELWSPGGGDEAAQPEEGAEPEEGEKQEDAADSDAVEGEEQAEPEAEAAAAEEPSTAEEADSEPASEAAPAADSEEPSAG